jgi:hypothetical protein
MTTTAINNLLAADAKKALKTLIKHVNEKTSLSDIEAPDTITQEIFLELSDAEKFEHMFKEMAFLRVTNEKIVEENKLLKTEINVSKDANKKNGVSITALQDTVGVVQHNTVKNIKDKNDMLDSDIRNIKQILNNQQGYLEKCRSEKTKCNIVLTGVKTAPVKIGDNTFTTAKEKLGAIMKEIQVTLNDDDYTLHDIPVSQERETQIIKITVKDMDMKKKIMDNKNKVNDLRDEHPWKYVYMKNDEPLMTRKENDRIRYRKRCLKREYPHDEFKIEKGKLYHGGVVVDSFNLDNQLF